MTSIYLWFNGVAYVLLGLWCAASVAKTSTTVGFVGLNDAGRCEYTAVYGGLQIGLGAMFVYTALNAALWGLGLRFALLLYVPIVLFRAIGLLRFKPKAVATWTFAAFELAMALVAGALLATATA